MSTLSRDLLLKLIENEIDAAHIFVAVAKSAYQAARFSEGNSAVSKAEAIHLQASKLAGEMGREPDSALAVRLKELRSAIDGLVNGQRGMSGSENKVPGAG